MRTNLLKDALYYLSPASGASEDRAAGVVVGMLTVLGAVGYSVEQSAALLKPLLPTDARINALPPSWRPLFEK